MENTSKQRVMQCIIIAVFSILMLLISITYIPCFEGGCALAFISFFVIVSSLAVAGILFYPMAKAYDAVINDTELMAHWTYDPKWQSQIITYEYEEHKERNKVMLIVIDGMILIVAFVFMIFVPEGGIETGIFMIGIAILMFVVAKITPGYYRKQKEKMPAEAWISRKGLIYQGKIYPYSGFLYKCNRVTYKEGKKPVLIFDFFQLTGGRIYDPFEIKVPVPVSEKEKAKDIADTLFSH